MQLRSLVVVWLAGCGGFQPDPLAFANSCDDVIDPEFCNDFDDPARATMPFGFAEFLGGGTTSVVVIDGENHGLSVASEGGAFGESPAVSLGAATSLSITATIEPFETAPGDALTLGLLLRDPASSFDRQVWVRAHEDHTLDVDALGIAVPTSGALVPGQQTTVQIAASWTPGGTTIQLDVLAAQRGGTLGPILQGHVIDLAPPPEVACAVAIISLDPGVRRFVFDDVTLDLR